MTDEPHTGHPSGILVAFLPCNDLDASERFYNCLGFTRPGGRTARSTLHLVERRRRTSHLTAAVEGWLLPGRNPFGLYFYTEKVDAFAKIFAAEILEKNGPEDKPWGMYEFNVSDPDETLVRVGWPSQLRSTR